MQRSKGSEGGLSNKQRYKACEKILVGKSRGTVHAKPQPDAGQLAGSKATVRRSDPSRPSRGCLNPAVFLCL